MESKAVGFDSLLKAYGFGLRISQLFTGGRFLKSARTYAKAKFTPLNPPDIRGRCCSLSYVGEGWGEVFA